MIMRITDPYAGVGTLPVGTKFTVKANDTVLVAVEKLRGGCYGCVMISSAHALGLDIDCLDLPPCESRVFIKDTPEAWGEYLRDRLAGDSTGQTP